MIKWIKITIRGKVSNTQIIRHAQTTETVGPLCRNLNKRPQAQTHPCIAVCTFF